MSAESREVAAVARHAWSAATAVATAAAVALTLLAACAHVAPAPSSRPTHVAMEQGEVSRALTARRASDRLRDTFRPIGLDELGVAAPNAPNVRPAAYVAGGSHVELWRGTYEGRTFGQRGALAIRLVESASSVRGVVAWRVARTSGEAFSSRGAPDDSVTLVRVPIVSVTRDSARLVLRLDSYFDPACNCTARATFQAVARGDTLVGRFMVDGPATVVVEGRGHWRAVRVP